MAGVGRNSIKSRRVRITALDQAGTPVAGNCSTLVSSGYTSIAISHEFEDGTEITQKNAWGEFCVSDKSPDALKNAGVSVEWCAVHPDVLAMMASMIPMESAGGITVGAAMTSDIGEGGFAIETWTAITPPTAGPGGQPLWLYWVFPFLRPGRLSDFTMEEGPLLITVESSTTPSTGWGDGPYAAATNPLADYGLVLPTNTHWAYVETEIQPPAPTEGCVTLAIAPDQASGATAGTPGSWTPSGATPPASVADLTGGIPRVVTANPVTAWTTGQYVQTATAGVPGQGHWDGSAWVAGAAP